MPTTSKVIYQPYVLNARGALKPGTSIECRTPEEGFRRAEKAMSGGSIAGARVVRMTHDDDAEEFGPAEHLGEFGQVPESE